MYGPQVSWLSFELVLYGIQEARRLLAMQGTDIIDTGLQITDLMNRMNSVIVCTDKDSSYHKMCAAALILNLSQFSDSQNSCSRLRPAGWV